LTRENMAARTRKSAINIPDHDARLKADSLIESIMGVLPQELTPEHIEGVDLIIETINLDLFPAMKGGALTNLKTEKNFWIGGATTYDTNLLGARHCWVTVNKNELLYTKGKRNCQSPVRIAQLAGKGGKGSLNTYVLQCAQSAHLPVNVAAARLAIATFALRMSDSTYHPTMMTPQPTCNDLAPLLLLAVEVASRYGNGDESAIFWAMKWLTSTTSADITMPGEQMGHEFVQSVRNTCYVIDPAMKLCMDFCDQQALRIQVMRDDDEHDGSDEDESMHLPGTTPATASTATPSRHAGSRSCPPPMKQPDGRPPDRSSPLSRQSSGADQSNSNSGLARNNSAGSLARPDKRSHKSAEEMTPSTTNDQGVPTPKRQARAPGTTRPVTQPPILTTDQQQQPQVGTETMGEEPLVAAIRRAVQAYNYANNEACTRAHQINPELMSYTTQVSQRSWANMVHAAAQEVALQRELDDELGLRLDVLRLTTLLIEKAMPKCTVDVTGLLTAVRSKVLKFAHLPPPTPGFVYGIDFMTGLPSLKMAPQRALMPPAITEIDDPKGLVGRIVTIAGEYLKVNTSTVGTVQSFNVMTNRYAVQVEEEGRLVMLSLIPDSINLFRLINHRLHTLPVTPTVAQIHQQPEPEKVRAGIPPKPPGCPVLVPDEVNATCPTVIRSRNNTEEGHVQGTKSCSTGATISKQAELDRSSLEDYIIPQVVAEYKEKGAAHISDTGKASVIRYLGSEVLVILNTMLATLEKPECAECGEYTVKHPLTDELTHVTTTDGQGVRHSIQWMDVGTTTGCRDPANPCTDCDDMVLVLGEGYYPHDERVCPRRKRQLKTLMKLVASRVCHEKTTPPTSMVTTTKPPAAEKKTPREVTETWQQEEGEAWKPGTTEANDTWDDYYGWRQKGAKGKGGKGHGAKQQHDKGAGRRSPAATWDTTAATR
jgi:hypothetical protein